MKQKKKKDMTDPKIQEISNYDEFVIERHKYSKNNGISIGFKKNVIGLTSFTGELTLKDLKELRKVVRKAIRNYDNI